MLTLCFLYHYITHLQHFNSLKKNFEKCVFVLKSQVALNELKPNSIDIMCLSIIKIYINHFNQYESLSLVEFFFIALKKIQNIANPNH
jgi:hypothetical protein